MIVRIFFSLLIAGGLLFPLCAPLLAATTTAPAAPPAAGQKAKALLQGTLKSVGTNSGYNDKQGIFTIIGNILKVIFGVLGIVFLIMLLYGGFLWMTDEGKGEQTNRAKDIIRSSIIGLIIVVTSYIFTIFIVNSLQTAAGIK
jgi:heme/copper-type cytochrome/quinol oxidase subunit 2